MITGKLRLAAWSSDVVRVYDLQEAGPILLWTFPLVQGSTPQASGVLPGIWFARDDDFVLMYHQGDSSPVNSVRIVDKFGDPTPLPEDTNFPLTSALVHGVYNEHKKTFTAIDESGSPYFNNSIVVSASGELLAQTGNTARLPLFNDLNYLSSEPFGRCLIRSGDLGTYYHNAIADSAGGGALFEDNGTLLPNAGTTLVGCWGSTGEYFVCVDDSDVVRLYTYDGSGFTHYQQNLVVPGPAHAIACSPDGRTVAISYDMTGSYQTRIYKRVGYYLSLTHTLPGNVGGLLSFSSDGKYLIDCGSKSIFEKDTSTDSWDILTGYLSSLPSGIQVQAVGIRPSTPIAGSFVYDGVAEDVATGAFNAGSLRMVLLDSSASFDSSHTTLDQVTESGARLVSSGNWPAAGKVLGTVTPVTLPDGRVEFRASNALTHLATGGDLSYRYGLIYDESQDGPVVFLDPRETVTVAEGYEVTWRFDLKGIIALMT